MDYESAFKRPFLDVKKLLIGILLSILPIINFFSLGYVLESAKLTLKKKNDLPEWENWKDMFIHGLSIFLVYIIYMIPTIILITLAIGFGFLKALIVWLIKGSLTISILEGIKTAAPLLISGMLLTFVVSYLLPIITINYIKTWKFSDAFKFKDIFDKVLTPKYFMCWIIVAVISTIIIGILHIIPFIGSKIGFFISAMISMTLFAQVYLEEK